MRAVIILAVLLFAAPAQAGRSCEQKPLTSGHLTQALGLAGKVAAALDAAQAQVAILARSGSDVSQYGLRYTHAGLVYRPKGEKAWTVYHKLNHCGREDSELFRQGLADFWLDDPWEYRALVLLPAPEFQARLLRAVEAGAGEQVNEPHYSLIAYPFGGDLQNSNGWLLELLASAWSGERYANRGAARLQLRRSGYTPTVIRIKPHERLGATLFKANVSFLDHPLKERLNGRYSIVSVESMQQWLQQLGALQSSRELAQN